MDKILIITGGNKGIGKGIVEAYQHNGYKIFSIARNKNTDASYTTIEQIMADLSQTEKIEDYLINLFDHIQRDNVACITLINNAGTLGEIGRIENLDSSDLTKTVQLNTIAPLILTATFLRLTLNWPARKKIISISSGAASKPYYGWAVYCATKAAIDMMTKTIALEQDSLQNGAKIIAVYPGVVNTEMQATIRKSNKENFASIDRFLELKADNALNDITTVGQAIFLLDQNESIENGQLIRIEP